MELAPCSDNARGLLLSMIEPLREPLKQEAHKYVIRTFPNIMVDICCRLIEQATANAKSMSCSSEAAEANLNQLKPFFVFGVMLGKSPQVSSLIYNYFEESSFQPLPEESFHVNGEQGDEVMYTYPGFDDALVIDILVTYFTYLSHNLKWFRAVWNWSELGRFIAMHPNQDIRYLATCCLSLITRPSRSQHMMLIADLVREPGQLIPLQMKHAFIYSNTSKPLVEAKQDRIPEFLNVQGRSDDGQYHFCSDHIAKVANVLLPKREISSSGHIDSKIKKTISRFVLVKSIQDTVSKIAYAASINKPCLIRGPSGSGKTSILDFLAAQTNRVNPPEYVKVQVGDQLDSKSLVGSYVCTDIPGQFEWQAGPLAQAMLHGSWIVFEDIDSAPAEMAQVIHAVIENKNLSCVSCCPIRIDNPHPDFKIFFTQRIRAARQDSLKLGFGFIERLCDIVDIPELSDKDIGEILLERYSFSQLNDTILKLFKTAQQSMSEISASRSVRTITLRDLFKFCNRIASRKMQVNDGKYSSSDLDAILAESIDCFIASLPHPKRTEPARTLGQVLNKPNIAIDNLLMAKPTIRDEGTKIFIGRASLDAHKRSGDAVVEARSTLAPTRTSLQLMESVSVCVNNREPVLLVGETGVGKTTIVQHLASLMNVELTVINLSQQSDSTDLLGGFRPVNMIEVIRPIHETFLGLFEKTFDAQQNKEFISRSESNFLQAKKNQEWIIYLRVLEDICNRALKQPIARDILDDWNKLSSSVRRMCKRLRDKHASPMALANAEGSLLKAVRQGKWILLDEINLAEPDVLQCLLLVLDGLRDLRAYINTDKLGLLINPKFRMFACMNPSTDIGKRDLPIGIRGRFTEFFVNDVDDVTDLRAIVDSYVGTTGLEPIQIKGIVDFYREARSMSSSLADVCGNSPVYSLRTLCRALVICAQNVCMNLEKSLLESFKITFLQHLNISSDAQVVRLMDKCFMKGSAMRLSDLDVPMPRDSHQYIQVEKFWIQTSSQKKSEDVNYILTRSVKNNLKKICRVLSLGQRKLPILIQGNTAVGKTSLIKYLAKLSGNPCMRINNHEHTDLEEYVGKYILTESGDLQFQEGLLVTAMRKGYWVILDELNLAPCELLEALNRVLDDNRELFIPETREIIKAHSKFVLFATQNPPEEYAGRKLLSRAFRNRFIELHFDDLPALELEEILHKRCRMPLQYAKKVVTVMIELQNFRRESGCFGGKNSFMTMRDLFRWGQRYSCFKDTIKSDQLLDWEEFMATEGLILLEGRARTINEADIVKEIIERVFKRKLDRNVVYNYDAPVSMFTNPQFKHVHFTPEFMRMFIQLTQALKYGEPVLLCGQTGCGKTTACQLHAYLSGTSLLSYNCHLNTESSDFIGNVRPSRDQKGDQRFPWSDGPLVQAMKSGSIFLMDEISLADDAVLERLNSVLEPERTITLSEKDGSEVVATESFRLVATMNPGGDYGKKELSPALRNRFTEIYCHNTIDISQIVAIIEKSLQPSLLTPRIAPGLIKVMKYFLTDYYGGQDVISLRDVLNWTKFLNKSTQTPLTLQESILHGASLVFFDQFGTCGHKAIRPGASSEVKSKYVDKLTKLIDKIIGKLPVYQNEQLQHSINDLNTSKYIKFDKFHLRRGPHPITAEKDFILDGPTVKSNAEKVVRALQLDRPILLEGDPGAGKTSIVAALARMTGHKLIRINLSDQTDISDLFGSDLPDLNSNDDDQPHFCWHDGPMLRAIKESNWILLDEMNLASQSVLEGLNACFDHRGEIYIPEIDKRFSVDRNTTRIFACQNPYSQGASRKGLPRSFINRFTSIYIASHTDQDLVIILKKLYPNLPTYLIGKMIAFNNAMSSIYQNQGHEFNLRDLIYWCDLTTKYVNGEDFKTLDLYEPERFVQFVYIDRMRSLADKTDMCEIFEKIFGYPVYEPPYRDFKLGEHSIILARSHLPRENRPPPQLPELCILKFQMPFIESIAKALEMNKMPILVGESGVGKRSMMKIIAGLTGNTLNILGANRDMDTIELLGSYEQKSLQREMIELVDAAAKFTLNMINATPRRSGSYGDSMKVLFKNIWSTLFNSSLRDYRIGKEELMETYRFQLMQLEALIEKLQPISINETEARLEDLKGMIERTKKKILFYSESTYSSGNFEWIDSLLVKSIKEGSWLMIENANLLDPATLDRLNSLVEPNGLLSLSEKGAGPDGIETLKPHKNFRLILSMNPEFGELSRAMRNRGVEIFARTRFYYEDFLMLLNQNGFQIRDRTSCMNYCIMQTSYDAHVRITGEKPENDGSLLAYFALNFSSVLAHEIKRGINVDKALAELLLMFYHHKGYIEDPTDKDIQKFIFDRMAEYKPKYVVDTQDSRYKWLNFVHDLRSMIGGDAIPTTLIQERKLLEEFSCPISTGLLKFSERIENFDIVHCCTSIKIFMEYSSPADFSYRVECVKQHYNYRRLVELIDTEIGFLQQECLPMIVHDLPSDGVIPASDMYIDTRNSPDFHYTLMSKGYKDTLFREDLQNRWILSLYRINLTMITEIIQESSLELVENKPAGTSLWVLSERVRLNQMLQEDLIRPQAKIVTDLFDLLNGLTRLIANRCLSSELVPKMMSRLFWMSYFSCKLKKAQGTDELIAICNQIPMLWALTYQKVIVPLVQDCELADVSFNNKKISSRIKHICEFLDISITKPGKEEKELYAKIINRYASTSKRSEIRCREIDKFFITLLGRYTTKSLTISTLMDDNTATLAASNLIWSNSNYMSSLYAVSDILVEVENILDDTPESAEVIKEKLAHSETLLKNKRDEYERHEQLITIKDSSTIVYRENCLNIHKKRCALDQFAPVWQARFIHRRLSRTINPNIDMSTSRHNKALLRRILRDINGVVMSPRYLSTLNRFLMTIERRFLDEGHEGAVMEKSVIAKSNYDMYSSFLVDHMLENIVLDNQIVGWMKLRVTTSDLSSAAPLIPEYSPIISVVSSYCLDLTHLKLNAYQNSSPQLDSMLAYLWRAYTQIKLGSNGTAQDLSLAKNLLHLRMKHDNVEEVLAGHQCKRTINCGCIDAYCRLRVADYDNTLSLIKECADREDRVPLVRALKLILFGYHHQYEYAPIFSLDPALRSREKVEVYKSELAHLKVDLQLRNTFHYWKSGENLRLVDITPEEAKSYPFSSRVLIDRRAKLERSLKKLSGEFTNRPKSDDGTLYYELRKEVEIARARNSEHLNGLIAEFTVYLKLKNPNLRMEKLNNLNTNIRRLIKNFEKSINKFRYNFILYSDITTQYLTGLCLMVQGMRLLHSRLEQKLQLRDMKITHCLVDKFSKDMMNLFSFNNFRLNNLESVNKKRELYSTLKLFCPDDRINHVQSTLLRSILIQMNHHIIMTPSDIKLCIPIVRNVADEFHKAWLKRKNYLEEQRKKREDLYQYRTTTSTLGQQVSFEHAEFLDVVNRFPLYDHIFIENKEALTENDKANLETEAQLINLNKSVDLTMCVDVCKAHYKFMKEASLNLLGQQSNTTITSNDPRTIDMRQLVKFESEIFYTMTRYCFDKFDAKFDSMSLECHLLQANELIKILRNKQSEKIQVGSLKSSIEILDEDIFDIYHSACPSEVLKFQELLINVGDKINWLKNQGKGYEAHPTLLGILKLSSRITSFLINDPLMKFVTGAHSLLQKLEEWNQNVPREAKMIQEVDKLIELIHTWRAMEIKSWRSSLHRVKRKYIDDTLCDLWFRLYDIFNDPVGSVIKAHDCDEAEADDIYPGFASLIKDFFEDATLGDYQIRLDLVFSFAIQTRFARAENPSRASAKQGPFGIVLDYEKLTTHVYNIYQQYQGLMSSYKDKLSESETQLSNELQNEIRIVNWQGTNLTQIKHNFRISHRKLNKVMNAYLKVLRSPGGCVVPQGKLSEVRQEPINAHVSERLGVVFDKTDDTITQVKVKSDSTPRLMSLMRAPKIITKSVAVEKEIFESSKGRYTDCLAALEDAHDSNIESIQAFHSHRVQALKILPHDSKDKKAEKMRTCRQMYHSKKFNLQAIFKSLQDIGVSYRRGWNSQLYLDACILSLEPLRGMIQNRSHAALRAAARLVDEALIHECNEMYRDIINKCQILLAQERGDDITGEQFERVKGSTYDIILDIILHSRNAAAIYKHMMDIQAAASRLEQLSDMCTDKEILVHKFSRVHASIRRFNDIASRAFSSVSKLELLMDCFKTYSDVQELDNEIQTASSTAPQTRERKILGELISEVDERFSLMTPQQFTHLNDNLGEVRKRLNRVCSELRDKLRNTIKNHLYGDDDIQDLQRLYEDFAIALKHLLPQGIEDHINARPNTILGSLRQLSIEAEQRLKPIIATGYLHGHLDLGDINSHSNLEKLDIRLQKLMKQVKIVTQEIHKEELDYVNGEKTSEAARRMMKPFNHINSGKLREKIRAAQVAKGMANCFMTLNLEDRSLDIRQVVSKLSPLMSIYTQELARYLNVIIISVHLKLTLSKQLIPFFIDLLSKGFGLPCKVEDLKGGTEDMTNGKENEDNVGFGEGEGANDASKKLEFESQLDELQKDDNSNDDDKKDGKDEPKEEHIDAHDDGVEMSDDFEAKAEGPEDKLDQTELDDEDDDQGEINDELDKEFDDVDQDDGQLDKQFWDDEDEPLGEDDEEDLRQADEDKSVRPEMDNKDLKAKDAALQEEKSDSKQDIQDQMTDANELDDEIDPTEEFDSHLDSQMEEEELRQEIDQENKENGTDDAAAEPESLEIDLTKDSDDEYEDAKMDGEQEPGQDQSAEQQDFSNDQEVDMELDSIDSNEDLSMLKDNAQELQGDATDQTGDDQDNSRRTNKDQSADVDEKEKRGMTADNANPKESDTNEMNTNKDLGTRASDDLEDGEKFDDKSSKRTFANRSSIEEDQTIKRQRIEKAAADRGDAEIDSEKREEIDKVQHLEKDKANAIEVVDILSDSDDEVGLLDAGPEKLDQKDQAARLKDLNPERTTGDDIDENVDQQAADKDQDKLDENALDKQQSTYNTNLGLLKYISHGSHNADGDITESDLMERIDDVIKKSNAEPDGEHESIERDRLTGLWLECTRGNGHLVHELCQQLQIVLQPTKMSKYKGDYKSGKRLNMRKIISYIASHYRKDKIWLRRTKPCKRTYNISLAVDNSSSMSENNCRQMTYQSLALMAKSLSLIEAGSLNVVSFGERVKCIHDFDQPYVDAIGAEWLKELRFDETRTSYAKLLRYSCDSFERQAIQSLAQTSSQDIQTSVNQLLIIISDGRNVSSEAIEITTNLRRLRGLGVLTLFLIIDDLEMNKGKSIMDVKSCVRMGGTTRIGNYMDSFPFPFYMLLRQMDAMPSILGDALRQWFELVSSG